MLNIWTKRSTRCNYPWFNLLLVSNLALVIKKKNFWALSYVVSCQMFGCIFGCIVVEILIRRFTMPRSFFFINFPFVSCYLLTVSFASFIVSCQMFGCIFLHCGVEIMIRQVTMANQDRCFFLCFPFASCYPLTFLLHNSDRWHRNQRNFICISSYKKGRWNNLF